MHQRGLAVQKAGLRVASLWTDGALDMAWVALQKTGGGPERTGGALDRTCVTLQRTDGSLE